MTKEVKDYFDFASVCSENGTHELVVVEWPFVMCKHCGQEFMLLNREMVDHFFEVKFFEERLSS